MEKNDPVDAIKSSESQLTERTLKGLLRSTRNGCQRCYKKTEAPVICFCCTETLCSRCWRGQSPVDPPKLPARHLGLSEEVDICFDCQELQSAIDSALTLQSPKDSDFNHLYNLIQNWQQKYIYATDTSKLDPYGFSGRIEDSVGLGSDCPSAKTGAVVSTRRFSVVVHLRDTKKRAWVPVMGCSVSNLEWSGGENRNEAFFVKEVDANRAPLKFVEIRGLTSSMIQKLTSLWRLMKNFMDRVLLGSQSLLESKMIMTSIDRSSTSESSTSQIEQIPPSAHDEPTDASVPISVETKKDPEVAGPVDNEIAWIEKKLDPLIVPRCCQSDPTIFNSFQGDLTKTLEIVTKNIWEEQVHRSEVLETGAEKLLRVEQAGSNEFLLQVGPSLLLNEENGWPLLETKPRSAFFGIRVAVLGFSGVGKSCLIESIRGESPSSPLSRTRISNGIAVSQCGPFVMMELSGLGRAVPDSLVPIQQGIQDVLLRTVLSLTSAVVFVANGWSASDQELLSRIRRLSPLRHESLIIVHNLANIDAQLVVPKPHPTLGIKLGSALNTWVDDEDQTTRHIQIWSLLSSEAKGFNARSIRALSHSITCRGAAGSCCPSDDIPALLSKFSSSLFGKSVDFLVRGGDANKSTLSISAPNPLALQLPWSFPMDLTTAHSENMKVCSHFGTDGCIDLLQIECPGVGEMSQVDIFTATDGKIYVLIDGSDLWRSLRSGRQFGTVSVAVGRQQISDVKLQDGLLLVSLRR